MGDGTKIILGVLVGALAALLLIWTFSGGVVGGMGSMMGGSMMGGGALGMLAGLVFWLAALALIVALVVWAVRQIQRR